MLKYILAVFLFIPQTGNAEEPKTHDKAVDCVHTPNWKYVDYKSNFEFSYTNSCLADIKVFISDHDSTINFQASGVCKAEKLCNIQFDRKIKKSELSLISYSAIYKPDTEKIPIPQSVSSVKGDECVDMPKWKLSNSTDEFSEDKFEFEYSNVCDRPIDVVIWDKTKTLNFQEKGFCNPDDRCVIRFDRELDISDLWLIGYTVVW